MNRNKLKDKDEIILENHLIFSIYFILILFKNYKEFYKLYHQQFIKNIIKLLY